MTLTQATDGDPTSNSPPILCDFCGRPTTDAGAMIEGQALVATGARPQIAHICASCAEACEGLFDKHGRKNALLERLPTPRELVAHLDQYIIGQERVKRTLFDINQAMDAGEPVERAYERQA